MDEISATLNFRFLLKGNSIGGMHEIFRGKCNPKEFQQMSNLPHVCFTSNQVIPHTSKPIFFQRLYTIFIPVSNFELWLIYPYSFPDLHLFFLLGLDQICYETWIISRTVTRFWTLLTKKLWEFGFLFEKLHLILWKTSKNTCPGNLFFPMI